MNSIIMYLYCLSKWIFFLWMIFHFNLSKADPKSVSPPTPILGGDLMEDYYTIQRCLKNYMPQNSTVKNFVPNIPKVGLKNPMVHQLLEELFDELSPFLINVLDYLHEESDDLPSSRHYTYQLGSQHSGCVHTIYMTRILSNRSIKHVSLQVKGTTKERGGVKRVFYRDILSPDTERAFIEGIEQALQEAKWVREHLGSHPKAIKEGPIKFTSLEEIIETLPDPTWKCAAYCKNPIPYQPAIPYFTGEFIPGGPPNKTFRSGIHPSQHQAFAQLKKRCQTYSEVYHTSYVLLTSEYLRGEYANVSNACRKVFPEIPHITFNLQRFEKLKRAQKLNNKLSTSFDWIGF